MRNGSASFWGLFRSEENSSSSYKYTYVYQDIPLTDTTCADPANLFLQISHFPAAAKFFFFFEKNIFRASSKIEDKLPGRQLSEIV